MLQRTHLIALGLAAALLAAFALDAAAATFGRLAVLSRLGEPLRAEIEVLAMRADERDSLRVELASPEVYRAFNLTPAAPLEGLRATLDRTPDGREVVRLTTTAPVTQSLLDLLVVLSSASSRVTRHFSFIVDPAEPPAPPFAGAPLETQPGAGESAK